MQELEGERKMERLTQRIEVTLGPVDDADLRATHRKTKWIPVTEKLPEEHNISEGKESDLVLVTIETKSPKLRVCQTARTIRGE